MTNTKMLVCDLDNTLYDWVNYFVESFYAMVDQVVGATECDREQLLDDFRAVHSQHRDSEHPFALLETTTIKHLYPGQSRAILAELLDSAFHAFNTRRKEMLRLYPSVRETLDTLSRTDLVIVAHTESNLYAAVDRLTRLDLTKYFQRIYCRERTDAEHPNQKTVESWLQQFPSGKIVELPHNQLKPRPEVLLKICRDEAIAPHQTAYVGDSIARDIFMARSAGVFAIWAKYGSMHSGDQYAKLVRVTHWTDGDVSRERKLAEKVQAMTPDYVLPCEFGEILQAILPEDTLTEARQI